MDSVKNYIVNYQVTAENKAGEQFNRIARAAKAAEENITPLMNQMRQINAYLKGLASDKNLEAIKQLYNIKPTMDFSVIDKQIKELQQKSVQAANQIARAYQKAFEGQETVGRSKAKTFSDMMKKNIDELKKERAEIAKTIANQFNGRYSDEKGFERLTTGTFSKEAGVSTTAETYVPVNLNDKKYLSKIQKTVADKAAFNEAIERYNTLQKAINQKIAETSKTVAPVASTAVQETVKQSEKDTKSATGSLASQYQEFLKKYDDFIAQFQTKQEAQKAAIAKYNKIATSNYLPSFKDLDERSAEALKDRLPNAYAAYKAAKQGAPEVVQMFKQKKELEAQKEELAKKMQKAASVPTVTAPTTKKTEKVTTPFKAEEGEAIGVSAVNFGKAAENLQKLNEAVASFKAGSKKINLTADITPATEQINKFLETVRSMRVAIPITFGGNGFNAKKAIDEATGKITDEGKQANKIAEGLFKEKRDRSNKKGLVASMPDIVKQLDETVKALNSKTQHIDIAVRIVSEGVQAQLERAVKELKIPTIEVPIQLGKLSASSKGKKGKAGASQLEQAAQEIQKQADSLKQQIDERNKNVSVKFKTSIDGKEAKNQLKTVAQELRELAAKEKIAFTASIKPIEGKVEDIVSKLKGNRKIEIPFQAKLKSNGMVGQMRSIVSDVKDKKVAVSIGVKLVGTGASAQLDDIIKSVQEKASKKSSIRIKVGLSKTGYWSDLNNIVKDIREQSSKRRVEIPIKLVTEKVSEQFSKLLSRLQKEAENHPIRINTTVNIAESMAKLRESVENLSKVVSKAGGKAFTGAKLATVGDSNGSGGGIIGRTGNAASERAYFRSPGKMMGGGANTDFYTRMRAWAYPITGNTSFGAQTPYALSMMKDMGSMMAVGGVMGAIGSSLHQAIDYQNTMKTVQAILQTSDDFYNNSAFNQMQHVVRNVGKETKFTAPQVAGAARFMAMAGLKTRDITNAIRPVADVALIGDTDLATTADKLTNVMTTFGLKSSQMRNIADIMTSTFTRSNTDMMMLAESAKYAGGIAHLYGGKDFMKTFSDTMAMFGVLGNSGIQASSAGTTIRMMYQNLMQPNKNQRETLQKYGIYTRDKNGQPLQMVDILKELAAKVPRDQMADAIGKMFRITAQPGAAALATHIYDLVGNPATGKKGLIEANREAMGTDVSGHIADQKKMTLSGLMYQVQSAFGEGILQSVERRQAKWAEMLGKLRDFLAKPETIESLSKIVDLVENMATVMLKFVNIWAKAYSLAPNLVNTFLTIQMAMTQLGYLITPLTQMVGILHTFGLRLSNINKLVLGGTMTGMATMGGASVGGVAEGALMTIGNTRFRLGEAGLTPYVPLAERKKQQEMAEYSRRMADLKHFANLSGRRAQRYKWFARDLENVAFTGMTLAESRQLVHQQARLGGTMPGYQRVLHAAQAQEEAMASAAMAERMRRNAQARMAELRAVQHERLMAIRRPMQLEDAALMRRFARMHPVENMKRSFSAGRALMAVDLMSSLKSMGTGIKGIFANLMGGLAKAVGMLTSPVGLAIGALAAFGAGMYLAISRINSYNDKLKRNADILGKKENNALKPQMNRVNQLELKYVGNVRFTSGRTTLITNSAPKQKTSTNRWVKTTSSEVDAKNAADSLYSKIYSNRNMRNAYYAHPELMKGIHGDTVTSIFTSAYTGGDQRTVAIANNQTAADVRARNAVYYQGTIAKATIDAQQKIVELRKQMMAGKIDDKTYRSKAMRIVNQTANPNRKGLLNVNEYSAGELSKNEPYWYRFKTYQQGARETLMRELTAQKGSITGYLEAIKTLKGKVSVFSNQWWNSIANIVEGMRGTYRIAGRQVSIALHTLPNGRIDYSNIIEQIRTIASNLKLNIADFANMAASVYKTLSDLGVIKGSQYYSTARKFVYSQIQHAPVSASMAAQWWDAKIGKGNKNAKYKGRTREQFIRGVSGNKAGDGFGKDRVIIRQTSAYAAADAQVRRIKAQQAQLNKLINGSKNGTKNTGTRNANNGFSNGISTGGGTSRTGRGGNGGGSTGGSTPSQKDYASTYGGGSSKPTQVIIQIDKLANFDRTMIAKDANDQQIIAMVENKISEALMMLSGAALNTVGSVIAQGVSQA